MELTVLKQFFRDPYRKEREMKKILSTIVLLTIIFTFSGLVSAGGSASYQTISLVPWESSEIGNVSINSSTSNNVTFTLHAVQFNIMPANIFAGNGITMTAYDSVVRLSKSFMSCYTQSGSYYTKFNYAKVGITNNSSQGVTATYSWSIVG